MTLQGPEATPARSIDVSAPTGWLTLRAIENQSRQLREIENAQRQAKTQAPQPKRELAPALPAPLDIKPVPVPGRSGPPAASVGRQICRRARAACLARWAAGATVADLRAI